MHFFQQEVRKSRGLSCLECSITVIRLEVSDLSFVLEIVFRFPFISTHDQPEFFNMGFNQSVVIILLLFIMRIIYHLLHLLTSCHLLAAPIGSLHVGIFTVLFSRWVKNKLNISLSDRHICPDVSLQFIQWLKEQFQFN